MNTKIAIIALALTMPLTVAAFPGGQHGGHEGNPAERVEHLAKKLDLTADQKTQLELVFKEQHEKREALHAETQQRLQSALNPEQLAKFEEMKKQRHEKWQKRDGHRMNPDSPMKDQ
jgi:protein CpxP